MAVSKNFFAAGSLLLLHWLDIDDLIHVHRWMEVVEFVYSSYNSPFGGGDFGYWSDEGFVSVQQCVAAADSSW